VCLTIFDFEQFVATLVTCGIKQEDIGVITPYRQQIKLLSAAVNKKTPLVEVLTADKSQGRDKDCIVISMVRSNDVGNVSTLNGFFDVVQRAADSIRVSGRRASP
jgi:DNA replication ATP-dependent helicase Dna2